MYGHRNPFEFRLSTRLMFAVAMFALVNLAPVNKGRAADDTLSSGNKNQMMIYGIVTRAFLYTDIPTTATGASCSMSTAASKTPASAGSPRAD